MWQNPRGTHEPSPGARVFVVDAAGRTIASKLTDSRGRVALPASIDADAKYVFAELDGFYLPGLPWYRGAPHYDASPADGDQS